MATVCPPSGGGDLDELQAVRRESKKMSIKANDKLNTEIRDSATSSKNTKSL